MASRNNYQFFGDFIVKMNLDFFAKELNMIVTATYTIKPFYYEIQTYITDAEVKGWDLKIADIHPSPLLYFLTFQNPEKTQSFEFVFGEVVQHF